eukprot:5107986-Amphidinium_carterae.1
MRTLELFAGALNRLRGALPEQGIRGMCALVGLYTFKNELTGILPESGLRAETMMRKFLIHSNLFEGMVPTAGLENMLA